VNYKRIDNAHKVGFKIHSFLWHMAC